MKKKILPLLLLVCALLVIFVMCKNQNTGETYSMTEQAGTSETNELPSDTIPEEECLDEFFEEEDSNSTDTITDSVIQEKGDSSTGNDTVANANEGTPGDEEEL